MDIYYGSDFTDSLPRECICRTDDKLLHISAYNSMDSFRKSASCRKVKSCNNIFKFRLSAGERIIFKYIEKGIYIFSYATHNNQIRIAKKYDNVKDIINNCIKWCKGSLEKAFKSKHGNQLPNNVTENNIVPEPPNDNFDEEDFDRQLDEQILELIKQGIISDELESVRESYLDRGDIDNAIKFDDIINIADMSKLYANNIDKLSCININLNSSHMITENDIRRAANIVYHNEGVCIFPYFYAYLVGTAEYKACILDGITIKNMSNGCNKLAETLIDRIGTVTNWYGLMIICLAYSDTDMSMHPNICLDVYPETNRCRIEPFANTKSYVYHKYGYKFNIEQFYSHVKSSRLTAGERIITSSTELCNSNLDFIFNK